MAQPEIKKPYTSFLLIKLADFYDCGAGIDCRVDSAVLAFPVAAAFDYAESLVASAGIGARFDRCVGIFLVRLGFCVSRTRHACAVRSAESARGARTLQVHAESDVLERFDGACGRVCAVSFGDLSRICGFGGAGILSVRDDLRGACADAENGRGLRTILRGSAAVDSAVCAEAGEKCALIL